MVDTKISALPSATCTTAMEFPIADGTTANNKVNLATIQGAQTKDGDVTITGVTTLMDKLRVEATGAGDSLIEFRHVDGGAGVDASIASRGADDVLVISNAQSQDIINVVAGTTVSTLTPTGDLTVIGESECSTFKMTTGAAAGYVLRSDAAGAATWGPDTAGTGEFIDARVGTSETYQTLGAAINAGESNILLTSDVTEVASCTLTVDITVWVMGYDVDFGDFQMLGSSSLLSMHSTGGYLVGNRTTAGYTFDLAGVFGTQVSFANGSTVTNCPIFNSANPPYVQCDNFWLSLTGGLNTGLVISENSNISHMTVDTGTTIALQQWLDVGGPGASSGAYIGAIQSNIQVNDLTTWGVFIREQSTVASFINGPADIKINLGGSLLSVDNNGNRLDVDIQSNNAILSNALISNASLIDLGQYDSVVLSNVQGGQLVNSNVLATNCHIENCYFVQTTLDLYGSFFSIESSRIEGDINVRGNKNHLVNNLFDTAAGGSAFVVTAMAGATNSIITNNQIATAVVDNGTNTLISNNSIHGSGPTPSGGIDFVDARVGPGQTYTSLSAAVAAGKINIYVVGNITEVADISLTQNITVWMNAIITMGDFQVLGGSYSISIHCMEQNLSGFICNRTTAGATFINNQIRGSVVTLANTSVVPGCSITGSSGSAAFLCDRLEVTIPDGAGNGIYIGNTSTISSMLVSTATNVNTTEVVGIGTNCYIASMVVNMSSDLTTHYAITIPPSSTINELKILDYELYINLGGHINFLDTRNVGTGAPEAVKIQITSDEASLSNAFIDSTSEIIGSGADYVTLSNVKTCNLDMTDATLLGWSIQNCAVSSNLTVAGNLHFFSDSVFLGNITFSGDKNHLVGCRVDSEAGGAAYVITVDASSSNTIITNNQLANAVVDNGTNTVYSNNNLHGAGPTPASDPFYEAVVGPTGGSYKYTTVNDAIVAGAKRILVMGLTAAVIETAIVDLTGDTYIMVVGEWRLNNFQIDMKSLTGIGLVIEGIGVEQSTLLYAQNTTNIPVLANQSLTDTNFSIRNITFDNSATTQNDCCIDVRTGASSIENITIKLPNFSNCGIRLEGAAGQPICNNLHLIGGGLNCSLALKPGGNYMEVNAVLLTGTWPINITPAQLNAGGAIIGVDTSPGLLHSINNLTINASNATSDTDKLPFIVSSARNWSCVNGSLMLGGVGQEGKIESIVPHYFGFVEYITLINGRQMAFENIRHLDWSVYASHPIPADVAYNNITSCNFRNTTSTGQDFTASDLTVVDCVFSIGASTSATASNINISDCNFSGTTTTLSANALVGATAIDVLASWGIPATGAGYRIKLSTGVVQELTITSIVGNTINFTPGLFSACAIGTEVGWLAALDSNASNSRVTNNNISSRILGNANYHSITGNFVGSNEHLSHSTDGIAMNGSYGVKTNNRTRGTVSGGTLGVTANNVENIV
jgi:hypothetical protein